MPSIETSGEAGVFDVPEIVSSSAAISEPSWWKAYYSATSTKGMNRPTAKARRGETFTSGLALSAPTVMAAMATAIRTRS